MPGCFLRTSSRTSFWNSRYALGGRLGASGSRSLFSRLFSALVKGLVAAFLPLDALPVAVLEATALASAEAPDTEPALPPLAMFKKSNDAGTPEPEADAAGLPDVTLVGCASMSAATWGFWRATDLTNASHISAACLIWTERRLTESKSCQSHPSIYQPSAGSRTRLSLSLPRVGLTFWRAMNMSSAWLPE